MLHRSLSLLHLLSLSRLPFYVLCLSRQIPPSILIKHLIQIIRHTLFVLLIPEVFASHISTYTRFFRKRLSFFTLILTLLRYKRNFFIWPTILGSLSIHFISRSPVALFLCLNSYHCIPKNSSNIPNVGYFHLSFYLGVTNFQGMSVA